MSYLPESFPSSEKEEDIPKDMETMYRRILQFTRPIMRSYTPLLEASTANGTVTYSAQTAWYIRQGNVVDYWFQVAWTNWAGGVGNIRLILPSTVIALEANYFTGAITTSNLSYANASDTWCHARGAVNENHADIISGRHAAASGFVQAQATGQITGHVRYWSQENA